MKRLDIMMIGLLMLAGCAGGAQQDKDTPILVDTQDSTEIIDTIMGKEKVSEAGGLIIPGESIGQVHLGQDAEDLSGLLGKADDGDAAMGKAWGIWNMDGGGQLSVFTSYKDSNAVAKDVKQVVVSSGRFATEKGIRSGSSFENIMKNFPHLQLAETYIRGKEVLNVYDDIEKGIAFDIVGQGKASRCVAITVHPVKIAVNNTYLTIHPGWQLK